MNFIFFAFIATAIVMIGGGIFENVEAGALYPYPPLNNYMQRRVRREVAASAAVAPNLAGGIDGKVQVGKAIGTPEHNAAASVFAAGNTKNGPVTTGGGVAYNYKDSGVAITKSHTPGAGTTLTRSADVNLFKNDLNRIDAKAFDIKTNFPGGFEMKKEGGSIDWSNAYGLGATISKERIPGIQNSLTQSARANLFRNDAHSVDASVFNTRTNLANGFSFERNGGNLDWAHRNGHGAGLGLNNIPGYGKQLSGNGNLNLYTSPSGNTKWDAFAGGSRWLSGGPGGARDDFGFGTRVNHYFG